MTQSMRLERYTSNACMDREDADALGVHLAAIARALATSRTTLAVTGSDTELATHYARLVRVMQRATQPDVVGRVPCQGVERITQEIENGRRTFTIRCEHADIVLDAGDRTAQIVALQADAVQVTTTRRTSGERRQLYAA